MPEFKLMETGLRFVYAAMAFEKHEEPATRCVNCGSTVGMAARYARDECWLECLFCGAPTSNEELTK